MVLNIGSITFRIIFSLAILMFVIAACQQPCPEPEFSTLPESKFFQFDSVIEKGKCYKGKIRVHSTEFYSRSNPPESSNLISNVIFEIEERCIYRILDSASWGYNTKVKIFDFKMREGDTILFSECVNPEYRNLNITQLILHNKLHFKGDSIFVFEHRNLNTDSSQFGFEISRFYFISEITGVYGECAGFIDEEEKKIEYWYTNGFFDQSKLYRTYRWEKVRLL